MAGKDKGTSVRKEFKEMALQVGSTLGLFFLCVTIMGPIGMVFPLKNMNDKLAKKK